MSDDQRLRMDPDDTAGAGAQQPARRRVLRMAGLAFAAAVPGGVPGRSNATHATRRVLIIHSFGRELQRWHIDEARLPPGSDVRFREPSPWVRYRWEILSVAAVIAAQAVLIGGRLEIRSRRGQGTHVTAWAPAAGAT